MSNLKEINLRISSLKNTKKITEAMKIIAVTKLSRAQNNVKQASNYYQYLEEISNTVKKVDSFQEHFLITERKKPKKTKVIVFTSDKGLCGPFNSNAIKKANKFITTKKKLLTIETEHFGKKGYEFFKKQNLVKKWYKDAFREDFSFLKSNEIIEGNIGNFLKKEIDELYVIYNRFESVLKQTPVIKRIIPLEITDKEEENETISKDLMTNFIYEPNQKEVINEVIKKIIYFEFYFAYLNTIAGENAARMTAMDNATNNCNDMIDKFTLERNQLRQANITKELIEIISGAEAI